MVRPRPSVVGSTGDWSMAEGSELTRVRWDLDEFKEDKVDVNTCKWSGFAYSSR
jgi:hypothetical protein